MHTSILRSVLVASRVTLPNRDGKIYIRDSDFKLPRLMSYLNCSTITSVFLLTIASHADVLMGSSRVRGYIDQSSRQISARENRLVIVKLDLDLVKDRDELNQSCDFLHPFCYWFRYTIKIDLWKKPGFINISFHCVNCNIIVFMITIYQFRV